MTPEEWAELERRVGAWAKWNEKKLAETARRAREAAEQVAEAAKVDPETTRKPMDI